MYIMATFKTTMLTTAQAKTMVLKA